MVTDGNETRSTATLERDPRCPRGRRPRLRRRDREPPVQSAPLKRLARDTGGSYRGAGSSGELRSVYAGIAAGSGAPGASSTSPPQGWRRPQARYLRAEAQAAARLTIPGEARMEGSGALQAPARDGVRELPRDAGRGRARRSSRTSRRHLRADLGSRLSPQEAARPAHRANGDEAEAGATAAGRHGLFRATERTFGHWRHWIALGRLLERSDVPLARLSSSISAAERAWPPGWSPASSPRAR